MTTHSGRSFGSGELNVLVLGDGPMAQAMANRLSKRYSVKTAGPETWRMAIKEGADVLLLALTEGQQVREVLSAPGKYDSVLDLTTQSPRSVGMCAKQLAGRCPYAAGGISSGASSIAAGEAVLLLGPLRTGTPLRTVAETLGRIVEFGSSEEAARGKLLHNAYLLGQQLLLAAVLKSGASRGLGVPLAEAICSGVAGRPAKDSSLLRVMRGGAPSSYRTGLVVKDLKLIEGEFPELADEPHLFDGALASFHAADPHEPFTAPLTRRVGSSHEP